MFISIVDVSMCGVCERNVAVYAHHTVTVTHEIVAFDDHGINVVLARAPTCESVSIVPLWKWHPSWNTELVQSVAIFLVDCVVEPLWVTFLLKRIASLQMHIDYSLYVKRKRTQPAHVFR